MGRAAPAPRDRSDRPAGRGPAAAAPRRLRRLARGLAALALAFPAAGCKGLLSEIFPGDDCSPRHDRPIDVTFETSEGPVSFERGEFLLTAASDVENCYTGVSLTLAMGSDDDVSSSCGVRLRAAATTPGIGSAWTINTLNFVGSSECDAVPLTIREYYEWDRISPGGYVKILRPDDEVIQRRDGCLREGIEIYLDARMVVAPTPDNPDAVKEFWFTENTYFVDEPIRVVEAFDCPF